jgi:AcrR family transcriptional regulator
MALAAAQRGFAKTRVADVIARAGVSRRTFYAHFMDRESCFVAAYAAVRSDVLVLLTPDDDADRPWQVASMPRCAAGWSTAPPGRTTPACS